MRYVKTVFALGAGVAMVGVWACSSSSSSTSKDGGTNDASADGGVDAGEDADASDAATCNPTSPDNACEAGMVCCFNPMSALSGGIAGLTSGFKGSCSTPSDCTASVSVQCLTAAGCAANQVCCLAGSIAGGGDAAAAAGIAALTSFSATSTCEQTCAAGQMQACAQTSDCKGLSAGLVCNPLQLGGGLGALGGAGNDTKAKLEKQELT